MATYRGLDGSLQFNGNPVGEVKAWQMQVDQELIDVSKMPTLP